MGYVTLMGNLKLKKKKSYSVNKNEMLLGMIDREVFVIRRSRKTAGNVASIMNGTLETFHCRNRLSSYFLEKDLKQLAVSNPRNIQENKYAYPISSGFRATLLRMK